MLLKQSQERHCYLLRHNSQKKTFKLTVKGRRSIGNNVFEHYTLLIKETPNGNTYQIKNKDKIFDKLLDLLTYYENNPIGYMMKSIGVPLACQTPLGSANTMTPSPPSSPLAPENQMRSVATVSIIIE